MLVWQVDEANGCEGEVVRGRQLYQELQQTHQQRYLRPSLYKRLSPAQRAILDVVDPETQPKL